MFKSCDYCRHRKKKCVVPQSSSRCTDCNRLDLPCEFSFRAPSLKRQQTSRKIAARVLKTASTKSKSDEGSEGIGENDVDEANLKEGDCQLRLVGRRDMANKRLFQPRPSAGEHEPMSERYWKDVHPFWPFADSDMLQAGELEREPDFKYCIDLAWSLSLNSMKDLAEVPLDIGRLISFLQRGSLSLELIAGILILCPFLNIDDGLLQGIFQIVEHELANATVAVRPPVLSAALLTNVWRRLAGHHHEQLHLPPNVLENYAQALDPETFGYHYLRLSRHAAEFDQRRMAFDAEGIQADTAKCWSKLEYECLLWQVCLAPTLLDTRDDLPATPESVVIHCFSSMLLLSLYSYVLENADTLGRVIALRPVPGVLLFLCSLVRSTFICARQLLDRMPLLVDMQAQTARIMLRLWHLTNFENCRGILNLWEDLDNRFPELSRQIREEIGYGPWAIDEIDGYSVFWTFRDLRTMTTKFIFGDHV